MLAREVNHKIHVKHLFPIQMAPISFTKIHKKKSAVICYYCCNIIQCELCRRKRNSFIRVLNQQNGEQSRKIEKFIWIYCTLYSVRCSSSFLILFTFEFPKLLLFVYVKTIFTAKYACSHFFFASIYSFCRLPLFLVILFIYTVDIFFLFFSSNET